MKPYKTNVQQSTKKFTPLSQLMYASCIVCALWDYCTWERVSLLPCLFPAW